MTALRARLFPLLALGLILSGPARAAEGCTVQRKAQLPLSVSFGRYTAQVMLNGQAAPMLVDTGAQRAFISPAVADRMRLPYDNSRMLHSSGVGGRSSAQHPRVARTIVLGGATWPDYPLLTAAIVRPDQQAEPGAPIGLIGSDMLASYKYGS